MDLISLAPSATKVLQETGADQQLIGATDYCTASNVDCIVGGWSNPDVELVIDMNPDLVFTVDQIQRQIAEKLEQNGVRVCHLEPQTIPETLTAIERIGLEANREIEGKQMASQLETRLKRLERQTEQFDDSPVVYCEEWPEPPMVAGNWVPEIVEIAGGDYPFKDSGERSGKITYDEVESYNPDYTILHYCGWEDNNLATYTERDWDFDSQIAVIDDDMFNQPGPNLVHGAEQLAKLLWGDRVDIEHY